MNNIDTLRLDGLFTSELEPCAVIGCGAIGSKLAVELAKIGVPSITLYDADIVEQHNLSNQAFLIPHLMENKAVATGSIIKSACDMDVTIETVMVDEKNAKDIRGFVFVCVDSMHTRRMLITELLKNPFVSGIMEVRMGVYDINVYEINSRNKDKWIELSSFDDSVAETSACGSPLSVGATSSIAASIMCWNFMKRFMAKTEEEEDACLNSFETILSINPWGMLTNNM